MYLLVNLIEIGALISGRVTFESLQSIFCTDLYRHLYVHIYIVLSRNANSYIQLLQGKCHDIDMFTIQKLQLSTNKVEYL